MKLIIVRHGETIENKAGIIQGQIEGTLSKNGLQQAGKLGLALRGHKIDFIYSSDASRTRKTLQAVLKYHPHVPVVYDPLIRERNYGEFEGRKSEEVLKELAGVSDHISNYSPKGGESPQDMMDRVKKFLTYLFKNHQDSETILICTHGGWKRSLYQILKKIPPEAWVAQKFDNASITILNIKPDFSYRFLKLNKTKHL